jgi:hypothetical protein
MHFPTYKYNIIWIALIFVGCYVSEIAEFWPFYMVRGGRKGGVAERVVGHGKRVFTTDFSG